MQCDLLRCSRRMAPSPTPQLEGQQGVHFPQTYADERVRNEFLHAIFNGSQSKGCFRRSRPNVVIFRAPLIADVSTHGFWYDECKMRVCRAWRIVLWQVTEEELTQHPSKRTVVLVELAIIVSPDGQVGCCTVMSSKARSYTPIDLRTGELGRHKAIPPRETDCIGKNRSRNRVSGA